MIWGALPLIPTRVSRIERTSRVSRYRPRKTTDYGNSEVEDIIWEVDEDCDGLVDWNNFVLMSCAPAAPVRVSYVY